MLSATASADAAQRTVTLPSNLGRLFAANKFMNNYRELFPAKGPVKIEADEYVLLMVNSSMMENPQWMKSSVLKQLDGIDFSRVDITDSWMSNLLKLPRFAMLRLEGAKVTDKSIPTFAKLKGLRCLSLRRTHVNGANLSLLKPLGLVELDLAHIGIVEKAFGELEQLTTLKGLSIEYCELQGDKRTKQGFSLQNDEKFAPICRKLASSLDLQSLSISGLAFGKKSLLPFASLKNLEYFRAALTNVDDEFVNSMKSNKLKLLNLNFCAKLTNKVFPPIARQTKLRTIELRHTGITAEGLERISGLSLKRLILGGVPLRTLKFASNMTLLASLDLTNTGVSDSIGPIVARFKEMRELILSENPLISDAIVPDLSKFSNLRMLDIVSTGISEAGFKKLKKAYPEKKIVWVAP